MTTMFSMDTIRSRLPAWKSSSKAGFDKSYAVGKKGFDKGWKALDKLGNPVNRLSNRLGSEAFWPMTLDKESEKAARILKAFLGGIEEEVEAEKKEGIPQGTQRVTKHIPREVIANAKAIAVFTACRTGLWVSSSGGSGILIRRLPTTPAPVKSTEGTVGEEYQGITSVGDFEDISLDDKSPKRVKADVHVWSETPNENAFDHHKYMTPPSTPPSGSSPPPLPPRSASRIPPPHLPPRANSSLLFDSSQPHHSEKTDPMEKPRWSPPSGILLHTAALGFLAGVDIYDCVMILNTEAAVEAFTNPRLTLGAEVSVAAGPYSLGGVLDQNLKYQKAKQLRNLTGKKNTDDKDTTDIYDQGQEKTVRKETGIVERVKEQRPVWSYMKTRGLYFGLGQLDGSIVIERTDENAEFYGVEGVKVTDILCGDITVPLMPPKPDEIDDDDDIGEQKGVKALWDVLESAGIGEKEVTWDEIDIAREKAKKAAEIKDRTEVATARSGRVMTGAKRIVVPQRSSEDDDPYGVRALERTGIQLIVAGSHKRVSSAAFGAMFPPTPQTPPPRPSTSSTSRSGERGFIDVPLRHERAIQRAEETIKEWEKQSETNRQLRKLREKRRSDSEILGKIQGSKIDFDFDKVKRRSTYS